MGRKNQNNVHYTIITILLKFKLHALNDDLLLRDLFIILCSVTELFAKRNDILTRSKDYNIQ
jgi:hypothetical protein